MERGGREGGREKIYVRKREIEVGKGRKEGSACRGMKEEDRQREGQEEDIHVHCIM